MNRAAITHRSKAEHVAQHLLERIIAAKLKPGSSLATEAELLSQLNVSRPTMRVKYARDRSAFGQPIGEFQAIRHKLAEMYRDIEASRSVLYRAAATANPFPDPYMAAVAKITVNEMSLRVTSDAIQIHGGYGFTDEFPVSRFYRGARYGTLGGGTTETLKDLIGKKIMKDFPVDGFLSMGNF